MFLDFFSPLLMLSVFIWLWMTLRTPRCLRVRKNLELSEKSERSVSLYSDWCDSPSLSWQPSSFCLLPSYSHAASPNLLHRLGPSTAPSPSLLLRPIRASTWERQTLMAGCTEAPRGGTGLTSVGMCSEERSSLKITKRRAERGKMQTEEK